MHPQTHYTMLVDIFLMCKQGHTVEVVMFKGDIDLHKSTLSIDKTYIISNASVSTVKEIFRNPLSTSNYQWTINSRTSIHDVDEGKISGVSLDPKLQNLSEVRREVRNNTLVSKYNLSAQTLLK